LKGITISGDGLKSEACIGKIVTVYLSNKSETKNVKCDFEVTSTTNGRIIFDSSTGFTNDPDKVTYGCRQDSADNAPEDFFYKNSGAPGIKIDDLKAIIGIDITA
jgi:hypothetical protein